MRTIRSFVPTAAIGGIAHPRESGLASQHRNRLRPRAIRALALLGMLTVMASLTPTPGRANDVHAPESAPAKTRFLNLGISKSVVIDLPHDIKDVLVADPKIANAVIRS